MMFHPDEDVINEDQLNDLLALLSQVSEGPQGAIAAEPAQLMPRGKVGVKLSLVSSLYDGEVWHDQAWFLSLDKAAAWVCANIQTALITRHYYANTGDVPAEARAVLGRLLAEGATDEVLEEATRPLLQLVQEFQQGLLAAQSVVHTPEPAFFSSRQLPVRILGSN